MKHKIIAITILVLMLFAFVGCEDAQTDINQSSQDTASQNEVKEINELKNFANVNNVNDYILFDSNVWSSIYGKLTIDNQNEFVGKIIIFKSNLTDISNNNGAIYLYLQNWITSQKFEMECSRDVYEKFKETFSYDTSTYFDAKIDVIAKVTNITKINFYPNISGSEDDGYQISLDYTNENVIKCKCINITVSKEG